MTVTDVQLLTTDNRPLTTCSKGAVGAHLGLLSGLRRPPWIWVTSIDANCPEKSSKNHLPRYFFYSSSQMLTAKEKVAVYGFQRVWAASCWNLILSRASMPEAAEVDTLRSGSVEVSHPEKQAGSVVFPAAFVGSIDERVACNLQ